VDVLKVGDRVMIAPNFTDNGKVLCGVLAANEIGVVVHLGFEDGSEQPCAVLVCVFGFIVCFWLHRCAFGSSPCFSLCLYLCADVVVDVDVVVGVVKLNTCSIAV
jgi:hypothetical protein